MSTLGFLHTAQVHVDTFESLVRSTSSNETLHIVLPDLLQRARSSGATPELASDVLAALHGMAASGADVVVCTCSTLGPIAEQLELPVPVVRIDRPMAKVAVATGARIGVVAALESTLSPTTDLLAEEAAAASLDPAIVTCCVPEAWNAFEAGETSVYLAQIAAAARSIAAAVDVIVLAQASMAEAMSLLVDLPIPVLVSPRLAVEYALTRMDIPGPHNARSRHV